MLDNGRWVAACSWTLVSPTCELVYLALHSTDHAHGGSRGAEGSSLFLFSMLLSISLVIAHTHIHTHACVEDFFTRLIWPHNVPTRESPFLVSLFVGRRPPFRVVVFRELQGCGTRPCPLLHHQQSFLPSALRLRRARRREICCSSLQKFTRTRTWVSMCVKKKQPLLLSNNGPHTSSPNV